MKLEEAKILISDDSILSRKQLKDAILRLGTPTFIETSNGQDAIDSYKREKPNLVFLDIVILISVIIYIICISYFAFWTCFICFSFVIKHHDQ